MKCAGEILGLFISQQNISGKILKESLVLDKKGIIDDKYYDINIQRSVLITSIESYQLASSHQITIAQGALGENILIDYNPYLLPTGTQLHIGEVILEISQNCTICDHLSIIDEKLPALLKYDRGIFAKVIKGGMVKKGDELQM